MFLLDVLRKSYLMFKNVFTQLLTPLASMSECTTYENFYSPKKLTKHCINVRHYVTLYLKLVEAIFVL